MSTAHEELIWPFVFHRMLLLFSLTKATEELFYNPAYSQLYHPNTHFVPPNPMGVAVPKYFHEFKKEKKKVFAKKKS